MRARGMQTRVNMALAFPCTPAAVSAANARWLFATPPSTVFGGGGDGSGDGSGSGSGSARRTGPASFHDARAGKSGKNKSGSSGSTTDDGGCHALLACRTNSCSRRP